MKERNQTYHVTHDDEQVAGPFDTEEAAREWAMDEAKRRLEETGDEDNFGFEFRVRPEWTCYEDPEGSFIIERMGCDKVFNLAKHTDVYEVCVFDTRRNWTVVDDTLTVTDSYHEALAALVELAAEYDLQ